MEQQIAELAKKVAMLEKMHDETLLTLQKINKSLIEQAKINDIVIEILRKS